MRQAVRYRIPLRHQDINDVRVIKPRRHRHAFVPVAAGLLILMSFLKIEGFEQHMGQLPKLQRLHLPVSIPENQAGMHILRKYGIFGEQYGIFRQSAGAVTFLIPDVPRKPLEY